jgi:hypothetical protein
MVAAEVYFEPQKWPIYGVHYHNVRGMRNVMTRGLYPRGRAPKPEPAGSEVPEGMEIKR